MVTLADLGEAVRIGGLNREQHIRQPLHGPPSVSPLKLWTCFARRCAPGRGTGESGEIRGVVTPAEILRAIAGGVAT